MGDAVTLLVLVGVVLVGSSVDDAPAVPGGEAVAAASGGGSAVALGGGASPGSMVGVGGRLVVVGGGGDGLRALLQRLVTTMVS